ncbi:MAG: histidine phosphatase family protein [Patescibacteria group bacterium]
MQDLVNNQELTKRAIEAISKKDFIKPLPKTSSKTPPILYVFRHGQSQDNEQYYFSGWRDPDLTKLGQDQAKILANKLKYENFDLAVSSTLKRAIQTLDLVLAENTAWSFPPDTLTLCKASQADISTAYPKKPTEIVKAYLTYKVLLDDRLIERSYGELQGTSKVELYLKDQKIEEKYRRAYDFPTKNGESLKMVEERVKLFLEELLPFMKERKINVVLSCHSNSMRALRRFMENLTIEEMCALENPLAQDFASYKI